MVFPIPHIAFFTKFVERLLSRLRRTIRPGAPSHNGDREAVISGPADRRFPHAPSMTSHSHCGWRSVLRSICLGTSTSSGSGTHSCRTSSSSLRKARRRSLRRWGRPACGEHRTRNDRLSSVRRPQGSGFLQSSVVLFPPGGSAVAASPRYEHRLLCALRDWHRRRAGPPHTAGRARQTYNHAIHTLDDLSAVGAGWSPAQGSGSSSFGPNYYLGIAELPLIAGFGMMTASITESDPELDAKPPGPKPIR